MQEASSILESTSIDCIISEPCLDNGEIIDFLMEIQFTGPVIFISSSAAYALKAFSLRKTVHFLPEPPSNKDLQEAFDRALETKAAPLLKRNHEGYKKRFLAKIGDKFKSKSIEMIAYFYAEGKTVYLVSKSQRKYIIEHSLDQLEKEHLDPDRFYRINRKFILSIDAIDEVRNYVNSRLKVVLTIPCELDMIVSREKVVDFKNWLNL